MKTRLMKSLLAVGALSLLGGCDTEQAAVTCRAASANIPFAVKYTPVGTPAAGCDVSPGELMQLSTYAPPTGERPSIAIGPGNALTFDADGNVTSTGNKFAVGAFATDAADANNTCSVPQLTTVSQTDATTGTTTYTFSNVQTYVSAANQGTQLKGDVTIANGACSVSYKMLGIWPAVDCTLVDAKGKPVKDAQGHLQPDDTVCQATDTGINPDVVKAGGVTCSPTLLTCVIKGDDFVKTGGDQ
ncbi:hypothetical protein FGE12_15085 [Aggregicoccus sp. 17bor-14]|uniref:hypothetical protein n=1 Tax=Myxococcaceae TaxID=31 RepID=UPI00129CE433|nr:MULTISPECIES: hypothetical protein [Myxococcaceae]MBF5043720.1 hypothetical protein [Simulacricoccus sp. 17bor-14]MRI89476.1 hypothetical protein [Aggregicoccus sp. 17bor-14]